jgi:UDP-N-acetylmuramyl pentapeptide phosphotransferase/UDP-N-acetylglucosamine-1-phosphate transferase
VEKLIYVIIAVVLFAFEIVYFRIAEHYRIIDRPNNRSSHKHPTIRGGGVIFVLAAILFSVFNHFALPYLILAVFLAGLTSLLDDIQGLSNWIRFIVHLVAALLVLYQVGLFALSPLWIVIITILFIGVVNAYNFMDGINGITGLYSLAVLFPLLITETVPQLRDLEVFSIIGVVIFLFFNARPYARCFAGDVGSVSIAIIILFLLISRITVTGNYNYFAFLLLYGIDAGLTIIQRLYLRENIFKAHRKHLFQIFCNEFKVPHLVMSSIYAVLQFAINIYIIRQTQSISLSVILILFSAVVYTVIKRKAYILMKNR